MPDPARRARAAVALTFFVHGLYFSSWTAHIPHVKASLGLSNSALGVVLLASQVGVVCAMALASRLLPRVGSRRMVRFTLLGYCATGPLVGLAPSAPLLFAALFFWGAFQAGLDVAMNTQGVALERMQGGRLLSGLHAGWSLGAFAGAAIGAGATAAGVGLTAQMLVLAVPILLAVTGASLRMVDDVEPVAPSEPALRPRRRLAFTPAVATLAVIAFAGLLCEGAAADWASVYLRTDVGTSAGFAGLGYTAFSLTMVATRLAGDRLMTRFPGERLLPALTAVSTVGYGFGLAVHTPAATLFGFACLGVGLASIVPAMFSAAGRLPGVAVGAGVSTVAAISYSGFVCGPPLIGALAGLFSLRAALIVLPLLTGLMTVLTARTRALRWEAV